MKKILLLTGFLLAGLMPLRAQTIAEAVNSVPNLSTLNAALQASGLDETLDGEGPFTLFAPNNSAFNALPFNLTEALLTDPDGVLSDILLHHVVSGSTLSGDLTDGQQLVTLAGQNVLISIEGASISVDGAGIVVANSELDNGVIHVINAVLVPETTTIFDVVEQSPDHNTLQAALEASGLDEDLSESGAFTLFAPTDEAFDNLPEGLLDDLLADPEGALADILLYHVANSIALSGDLVNEQTIQTLAGETISISTTGGNVFLNDAQVTTADIVTINGVVHVIDAVLVPEDQEEPTLMEVLSGTGVHSTLVTALEASGLDETLSGPGTFTVFAPSDAAFLSLPDNLLNAFLTDPEGVLTDLLLHHVVGEELVGSELTDGLILQSLFEQSIEVGLEGSTISLNESADVSLANFQASNGVMHLIDGLLIPETTTIFDVVEASEDHNTLEAALLAASLDETLSGSGAFTLFAPTDAAFDNLPDGLLDDLLADPDGDLASLLLGHVIDGVVLSDDLEDEQQVTLLNGDIVTVSISAEGVFIDDAEVTVVDIVTLNGIVHVIDAVLGVEIELPTIFEIVQDSEIHNTLEAALVAAELDGTLSGEGEFTLFAPTDEAFDALPENLSTAHR
ncbi:MAG: fasciclin domain-containing protein [Flavobacteriales bacterium]|nr:fasciclin domain-containing protein [Flavobacteriales bacterium]